MNNRPPSPILVPYAALPLQMRRVKAQVMAAIEQVLEHGQYVLGPEVASFERDFAEYCGTKYAVGVSDGTAALVLALRAIGIGPGDEVITTPNSFIATAAAPALLGATPVFVDVRPDDMNIDPKRIEGAITQRTKAIIPVHLAGHAADMEPILEIGRRRGIPVIEDAAQAVGSLYRGRRTGSFGLLGCFSCHPLKNLHAYGDGGVVTTDDPDLYAWLLKARNHGLKNRDESAFWSVNSRLDTLQAAVLRIHLQHLDEWTEERRGIAAEYAAALEQVVDVPRERPGCFHSYQTYVIKADRRSDLLPYLLDRGVDAKVHYPQGIPFQEAARHLGYNAADLPAASTLAEGIVSLPLYPELTSEQRLHVIASVRSFYGFGT